MVAHSWRPPWTLPGPLHSQHRCPKALEDTESGGTDSTKQKTAEQRHLEKAEPPGGETEGRSAAPDRSAPAGRQSLRMGHKGKLQRCAVCREASKQSAREGGTWK